MAKTQTFATPVKARTNSCRKSAGYVFVEGSVQRLDAGRLDLGVVRDSTLDATNDYETFVEVFETVVSRGFANSGLQLILKGKPLGASAKTA